MASKDRTGNAAKPSKKLSQKEQSERFIATARELEADESGEAFDRAVEVVLPIKQSN